MDEKIKILGIGINSLPLEDLLLNLDEIINSGGHAIVANVNAHALMLASKDDRLLRFLNNAEIVFCDGYGVRLAAKLLGYTPPPRYTPPDWIGRLSQLCVQRNYKMYFLGALPGVAEKAANRLREIYPGLNICGVHHGYFDQTKGSEENAKLVTEINKLSPNILVVGFGMPIQEFWIADHWDELDVNIALPVGALFDYVSGEIKRAPRWMTEHSLEWLGRLIIEPRRLWRRYIFGTPGFIFLVVCELWSEKVGRKRGQKC